MHDVPYSVSLGPEVVACMTAVCAGVRSVCPSLPLGVQILSAANQQALAVALASGSVFTSSVSKLVWGGYHHMLLKEDFFCYKVNSYNAVLWPQ